MATTPVPNRIRTRVPKNSANNSALSVGFPFIADSPDILSRNFVLSVQKPHTIYPSADSIALFFLWWAQGLGSHQPQRGSRNRLPLLFTPPDATPDVDRMESVTESRSEQRSGRGAQSRSSFACRRNSGIRSTLGVVHCGI